MQEQQLGESPSNMEALNWTSLTDCTASISSMCLSQNNEGTGECNMNESSKKKDQVELEMIQQSLPQGNGTGRNSEGFSESIHCKSEPNSSWGDFESFSESLVKAESFNHTIEVLVNSAETKMSKSDREFNEEHCSSSRSSRPSEHNGREASCGSLDEANLSYEDIFKLCFPEVSVLQSSESIRSLDQVLDTNNEDAGIPEFMKRQLCIDFGNPWRILRDTDSNSGLRCPENKSHCQENFLSVLGIDVTQKGFSGDSQVGLEETNIKVNQDVEVDGFNLSHCKALIQTKLSVSPDSRHGHLFNYNLFLKRTPSNGNMQFKTAPRKKMIFTTPSLKMKIFNNDVC